ncbi:hypothetical protein DERP_014418 [Dermatophagoides pteronyssinus]|uniref:Uncharacterized protein n=1 Tax=Dermatophagoides pteronyssinus TaxID=6956 RepID=A0ABQ8J602_DERPT|nr:hypothetical protein DERP_014418 [Dermatophagoides pteronyssinus]
MGIISNQNDGILLILYDKLSYSLVILKLKENYYANSKLEWTKSLLVDSNLNSLYEINENITEHENEQQQQELTKSFQQIFGPHTFTFGFVNDNRIYLFSNQDEKLISFASDFIKNTNFSYKKYPFNIQSYQDFFHCNKHNDPTTTTTTTAQQQHSSTTNDKHPTTITAESQNPMINNNNITRKSNHSITTTTTVPSIDEEQSTFPNYKLNLIDGQMMNNELDILITSNVVKQLMTVINWIDDKHHHLADNNNERPILSMAISINEFGSIRIYCLKSFDQYKYIIGDYNQEIDFDQLKAFFAINDQQKIRGTISNENQGILSSFYGKNLSFSLDILKLNENYYGNTNFEWTKSLAVDSSKTFIYEINDYPSKTERKTLTKSFQQIFGPHQFTYGFVTDNKIYLFSNQDEKLISFSSEFTRNRNDSNQKYPFKLQSFKDFFHCNQPLDPVIIDKNKQTTTTTVKQQSPTTTIISTMKTAAAVTKSSNIITTNKSNDSIITTTTTDEASIDEEHSTSFPIIIIILPHNVTTEQPKPKPKPISCGIEYLKETIGLSITNKHLYQFLLINDTIEVIKYEYRKLSKNNYKLNMIDGQMMVNGLKDLIPENMVEELMIVIHWNDGGRYHHSADDDNNNEPQPIINFAMSINKNEKIRIFCLKSYDQSKYYVGEYIQEIDSNKVEKYFGTHDQPQIRCTISNENEGIISSHYSKSSYSLSMIKLKDNSYSDNDPELKYKTFLIDSSLEFIYQLNENPNDEQKQELTKSFNEIFGQHRFTYGFVDENQIYLFSNQDEKLISFSMNAMETHSQKYPFKLQSYQDFFHCNKPVDPIKIDDKQHKEHNKTDVHNEPDEEHDDHNHR